MFKMVYGSSSRRDSLPLLVLTFSKNLVVFYKGMIIFILGKVCCELIFFFLLWKSRCHITLHWKCQSGKSNELSMPLTWSYFLPIGKKMNQPFLRQLLTHTAHSAHIWRIFWPVYHRPSKRGSSFFFQLVKNEPLFGPK